jgi:signal transduction histidine kinase
MKLSGIAVAVGRSTTCSNRHLDKSEGSRTGCKISFHLTWPRSGSYLLVRETIEQLSLGGSRAAVLGLNRRAEAMKKAKPSPEGLFRICVRKRSADTIDADARARRAAGGRNANIDVRLSSLQEAIQQQLASDLHDSTCQYLIAASLSLLRLRHATSVTDDTKQICDDIDASINRALREIRAVSYSLYPHDLLSDGLKVTIEEYVKGYSARTSLKSIVDITPEVRRLPYGTQRSLLRLVQEALMNVFRHANATQVKIAIEARRNGFRLRVIDNGCGIPTGQAKSAPEKISIGVGIPGMRSRVHQLGGTFEIRSSARTHRGTTMCAVLPYPPSREALLLRRPKAVCATTDLSRATKRKPTGGDI